MRTFLLSLLPFLPLLAHGAELLRFAPQGRTAVVHQVSARFSEPMAALGDQDAAAPFEVDCRHPGRAQWLSPTTWTLEFERALPPGARCGFRLKQGLRALSGAAVAPRPAFTVDTAGVSARWLNDGLPVEEDQVFAIGFDAQVDPGAALKALRCQVGDEAPAPMTAAAPQAAADLPWGVQEFVREWRRQHGETVPAPYLLARCATPLPAGRTGSLLVDAALASSDGVRAERAQRLDFRTADPLAYSVDCASSVAGQCHPGAPIILRWNAPLSDKADQAIRLALPDGRLLAPGNTYSAGITIFEPPFPQLSGLKVQLPPDLRDERGRAPVLAAGTLDIRTHALVTHWQTTGTLAVVAAGPGAALPLAVPHRLAGRPHRARLLRIDTASDAALHAWLARLHKPAARRRLIAPGGPAREVALAPASSDPRHRSALALPGKGLYVAEWPDGPAAPRWIRAAALVTDLALHVRQARESSLVWVTSIASGSPLAGVRVSVARPGRGAWTGVTGADGLVRVPFGAGARPLFVVARSAGDVAFTPLDPASRKEFVYVAPEARAEVTGTVFDTTLLQPGGTLHMKHLRRIGTAAGLALPPDGPVEVVLEHEESERSYRRRLRWRGGQALQDWTAPPGAPLGTYAVRVGGESSGRFRLEAAAPAHSSATVEAPRRIVFPQRAVATLAVTDLNGGPGYGPASVRISVSALDGITFPAHPGLRFATVLPERVRPVAQPGPADPANVTRVVLDKEGRSRFELPALASAPHARALTAEFAYQDASGRTRSVRQTIEVAPARELVAVELGRRDSAGATRQVGAVVVDLDGKPLAGRTVRLSFLPLGGATAETPVCSATSDAAGRVGCAMAADPAKAVSVIARLAGADGLAVAAHDISWSGQEPASDSEPGLHLAAPRDAQAPGATVRIGIVNPLPAGWMLWTVEREGILDAQVRRIGAALDHVELRLRPEHAPNVTVNVIQTGGRSAAGGGGFWAGASARLEVRPDAQRLDVTVDADRQAYRPGEQARVSIAVRPAAGGRLPAGAEVAVAVVDDGLLEVWPNDSWDLLAPMMRARWPGVHELGTMNVLGPDAELEPQRSVEAEPAVALKAPPAAAPAPPPPFIVPVEAGGAAAPLRTRFGPQVLWRARVPLDAHGRAQLPVRLSDALTRFRIVAVAQAGADRFGHGSTSVLARQDLELRSLLPPSVRAGDRLQARFLVRNRAQAAAETLARIGLHWPDGSTTALTPAAVRLAPGQAQELAWQVDIPAGLQGTLAWSAAAGAGAAQDRLRVEQAILAPERPRTLQAALLHLDRERRLPLRLPAGAENGQLGVALGATLDGGLAGVRRFFAGYPYTCFEQRASRALALDDRAGWARTMGELDRHLDRDSSLLRYFSGEREPGSALLTAQLLDLARHSGARLPEDDESTLLHGLERWKDAAHPAGERDPGLRRLAVLAVLAAYGRVDAAVVDSIEPLPDAWPASSLVDWMTLLRHSGHPRRARLLAEASEQLRARLYTQGTALALSGEASELRPWMMGHADISMARLLLAVRDLPGWRDELPLLARGLMNRQRDGHWHTTLANAWGALAMRSLAARGAARVGGSTVVALGGARRERSWPAAGGKVEQFALPAGASELALRHAGSGAPWATVQAVATVPLAGERFNGIRIRKTVTPVEQRVAGQWSRGDVARVRLELEARADMNWVVVDDPVPAGATVLGSGLKGDSTLLAAGAADGLDAPTYQERAGDALRSYYQAITRGRWQLEYTLRLDSAGAFRLPATHAEAMYQPEVSADLPNAIWAVRP